MIPLAFVVNVEENGPLLPDAERHIRVATRRWIDCEITLRMYDADSDMVTIVDFKKTIGGNAALYRFKQEPPTVDDRRFLAALERGEAKHVDVDGRAG